MLECLYCGEGYPPAASRWRCPSCGYKAACCEGMPQTVGGRNTGRNGRRMKGFDDEIFE